MLPQVTAFATETRSDTEVKNYRTGVDMPNSGGDLDSDSYGTSHAAAFYQWQEFERFRSKAEVMPSKRS